MHKLIPIVLLATVTPFCAQGQQGGTLTGALASQGLAGAKLERRYGNHLLVPVSINNRHGALMIDTGSPNTLIDRNSVNTFGLTVEKTDTNVGGLFGMNEQRNNAATGSNITEYKALAHLNGVLGAREMIKYGMIIDCARQMLYINP